MTRAEHVRRRTTVTVVLLMLVAASLVMVASAAPILIEIPENVEEPRAEQDFVVIQKEGERKETTPKAPEGQKVSGVKLDESIRWKGLPKKKDLHVLIIKLNWNDEVSVASEISGWKISTLEEMQGAFKLKISDIFRSRNYGAQHIIQSSLKNLSAQKISHILFVNQDVTYTEVDIARLLRAAEEHPFSVLVGLSVSSSPPFAPLAVPQGGHKRAAAALLHSAAGHELDGDRLLEILDEEKDLWIDSLSPDPKDDSDVSVLAVDCAAFDLALVPLPILEATAVRHSPSGGKVEGDDRWEWFMRRGLGHHIDFWLKQWDGPDIKKAAQDLVRAKVLSQKKSQNSRSEDEDSELIERITMADQQAFLAQWTFGYINDEDISFCERIQELSFISKRKDLLLIETNVRPGKIASIELKFPWATQYAPLLTEHTTLNPSHWSPSSAAHRLSGSLSARTVENRFLDTQYSRRDFILASQRPAHTEARIVLLTPVWDTVSASTDGSLFRLAQHPDIVGRIAVTNQRIIEARNELLRTTEMEFGLQDGYTHVLFVDSDMTFSPRDLDRLIAADKDIIFGLAFKRTEGDPSPAYLPLSGIPGDHDQLMETLSSQQLDPFEVRGGGMAFTLIKKKVIDSVKRAVEVNGQKTLMHEYFWDAFVQNPSTGRVDHLTEDYTFCQRARDLGFRVFLHPAVQLGHIGHHPITIRHWFETMDIEFDQIPNRT